MAFAPDTIDPGRRSAGQIGRLQQSPGQFAVFRPARLIPTLLLALAALMPGEFGAITRSSLVDAYIQVSVFVAATLFMFYLCEERFGFDIGAFLRGARLLQIPVAAVMGALPGCGGAVIVVASYTSGNVSMGAVVATLTATMGDAAFLLIAKRPDAALVVLPLSMAAGIVTGYVVDLFDRNRFRLEDSAAASHSPLIGQVRWRDRAYGLLALPGLVFGIAALMQVEFQGVVTTVVTVTGLAGAFLGVAIWAISPVPRLTSPGDPALARTSEETGFITVWVIAAFLVYEYLASFAGLDLEAAFRAFGGVLPLIAIGAGFIPGCGPQVLVTTLYISGVLPFSALIGNAIANDGDALFPAIALTPRAALLATLYSAVPALIIAYTFHFLLPGFL